MPNLLIRNVPQHVIATLKDRAKRHGSSLQAEVLAVIEEGTRREKETVGQTIARFRAEGRLVEFDVNAALRALREDRDHGH